MELLNFQLVGNIITITALTSLALICGILKRDNDRLNAQMQHSRREKAQRAEGTSPVTTPKPVDIREFVAQRSQTWMNPQSSNAATE